MSRLLCAMETEDPVDPRFYNSLLLELSQVYVVVSNNRSCWDAAADAGAFRADALIDDIRVSICIDNSIAPTNPLLTVKPLAISRGEGAVSCECTPRGLPYSRIWHIRASGAGLRCRVHQVQPETEYAAVCKQQHVNAACMHARNRQVVARP